MQEAIAFPRTSVPGVNELPDNSKPTTCEDTKIDKHGMTEIVG